MDSIEEALERLRGGKQPDAAPPDSIDTALERLRRGKAPQINVPPSPTRFAPATGLTRGDPDIPVPGDKPPFVPTSAPTETGVYNPEADQLQLNLNQAAERNPKEEARKQKLAEQLDTHPDLLPPDAEAQVASAKHDPVALLQSNPAVARFLQDYRRANLVGPNIDPLIEMDETFRRLVADSVLTFYKATLALAEGAVGMIDLAAEAAAAPFGIRHGGALGWHMQHTLGFEFEKTRKIIDTLYSPEQQARNKEWEEAKGVWDNLVAGISNPSVIAHIIGESGGPMVGTAALGRALLWAFPRLGATLATTTTRTPQEAAMFARHTAKPSTIGAAATAEGATVAGLLHERIRQETPGGLTDDKQQALAVGAGVASAGLSVLGMMIASRLGVADLDRALLEGTLKQPVSQSGLPTSVLYRIPVGAAVEGAVQEAPQEVVETIAENVALGRPWDQGLDKAAAGGFLAGAGMGGATQTVTTVAKEADDHLAALDRALERKGPGKRDDKLMETVKKMVAAGQAEDHKAALLQLGKQAAESELRKNSPEAFREFIQIRAETEGVAVDTLYVAPDKLTEVFAQTGMTPSEVREKMPDLAQSIAEAQASGGDVAIPITDYATHISGTPTEDALIDHVRTSPDGMTYAESQAYYQEAGAEFEAEVNRLIEETEPVLTREEYAQQPGEGKAPYEDYLKTHANQAEAFSRDSKDLLEKIVAAVHSTGRFHKGISRTNAIPIAQFYATHAARMGLMPSELYARAPISFDGMHFQSGMLDQSPSKIDTEYLAAVERGDMETAQRMVDEAAARRGYTPDAAHRMQHQAPDRDGGTRLDTVKDADLVPDDYWTHPQWYQDSNVDRESFRAVTRALKEKEQHPERQVTLTVYRAIPKNVKESGFRNGDWVTPSREDARQEGELTAVSEGGYRVISMEVPIEHLWWDGNSIAELGYDDGKGYVYKDTKNFRKSTEPVTYDEAGNVIPLSKRFDLRKSSEFYQFVGPQAIGADLMSLSQAEYRIAQGENAEDVRQDTGWHKGRDGKWRFEISDDQASLRSDRLRKTLKVPDASVYELVLRHGGSMPLSKLLKHDRLYAAYPGLKDATVEILPRKESKTTGGSFDPNTWTIKIGDDTDEIMLSTLLHEIQHGIQTIEGFARGGNPAAIDANPTAYIPPSVLAQVKKTDIYKRLADPAYREKNYKGMTQEQAEQRFLDHYAARYLGSPFQAYRRLMGEWEARNTEDRQAMTDIQREILSPLMTADPTIKPEDVIVVMNGQVMESAPPPANGPLPSEFFQSTFYSALEREIGGLNKLANKQGAIKADQAIKWINSRAKDGKFKKEEVDAVGVLDWLEAMGDESVPVSQIEEFIANNGVQVVDVMHGAEKEATDAAIQERAEREALAIVNDVSHDYWSDILNEAAYDRELDPNDLDEAAWRELLDEILPRGERLEMVRDSFDDHFRQLIEEEGIGTPTHFDRPSLNLPGGQDYRELALVLPGEVKFTVPSAHAMSPEANTNRLAHVRFNTRTTADGKRVLFIEEIQSDWGQQGRELGFSPASEIELTKILMANEDAVDAAGESVRSIIGLSGAELTDFMLAVRNKGALEVSAQRRWRDKVKAIGPEEAAEIDALVARRKELLDEQDDLVAAAKDNWYVAEEVGNTIGSPYATRAEAEAAITDSGEQEVRRGTVIPDTFVTDTKAWVNLALKRMLRYASENGFDSVAWTTGKQQADRYSLSKVADEIRYTTNPDRTFNVSAFKDGRVVAGSGLATAKGSRVAKAFGREVAKMLRNQDGDVLPDGGRVIDVRGKELGGEGMRGFYDAIVPQVANATLKKLKGPKVGMMEVEGTGQQPGFDITPELAETVMQGLPLFQRKQVASFNPETLTVSLLNGSNLSSIVHESGHFYLEMMERFTAMPEATQEMKDDFTAALKWFGLDEATWRGMNLEQRRPYHEQWAQSFELYMLEGKAPSVEMRGVFSRIRDFMLEVYKSIKEFLEQNPLAGHLNDDVRAIFDRLLASRDAIREAEQVRGYADLLTDLADAGLTDKQLKDYAALDDEASQLALDQLGARSIKDMQWLSGAKEKAIRALQRKAATERSRIRAEVTAEVMSEPVNQARTYFRKGEITNADGSVDTAPVKAKLSSTDIKSLLPDLNLSELRGMTSKDGLPLDLAAQQFGFSSGEALLQALLNEEKAADKIRGLTDQRMLEEHGDLVDEASLDAAADEAVHNEARARFLATGLKLLTKSGATTAQLVKAAKIAAENAIAAKKIRDIRAGQYKAAEAKANRAAKSRLPKDPQGAIQAQRAALMNNSLGKAAIGALAEVDKILRHLEKFRSKGVRKSLHVDYMEQIDDLLQAFDLRRGTSIRELDRRQSLADWISEQEGLGFEPAIDTDRIEEIKRKHYKDMTMEELRFLDDTVRQIEHLGRLKKKLLTAKDKRELEAILTEARESITRNAKGKKAKDRGKPTDAVGHVGKFFRTMAASHRKFASILRQFDGGKDNGILWRILTRGMNHAGDTEVSRKAEAAKALKDIFDRLPRDTDTTPGNIYTRKRVVPGTDISMTRENRIMFGLNWGNEGNRQRLLDGGLAGKKSLTPAEAQAILDTLTKEEWEFIYTVADHIASYKTEIGELERDLTGVTPKWVEVSPVETRFGTHPGWYFPAKYDADLSARSESQEAVTDLRMGMKGAFGAATTRKSHVKTRAAEVKGRPLELTYDVISRHLNEVIHRLAWQRWLTDANRLLMGLDETMREHYGPELVKELKDAVVNIAEGDAPARTPWEKGLNRLRTGSTIVGLGWRFTTAALQLTGFSQTWARIGARAMFRGMGQFLANPNKSGTFAFENSRLLRDRNRTMIREISEIMNTLRAGEGVSRLTASYFYLISKLQSAVDIPTWLGAYEKALEANQYENAGTPEQRQEIEQLARDLADQAVLDAQSGGQIKDLASIQRGGPALKLFTNFYSYFSATYNLNVEVMRRTDFKSPTEVAFMLSDLAMLNVIPVLFSVALKEMAKGKCGDDWDCLFEAYLSEQIGFMAGQMIPLREIGAGINVAATGEGFGYQGPAGLRFFGEFYKLGQQLHQGEADWPAFKAALNATGMVMHFPAGQTALTIEGIMAIEQGRVPEERILPALMFGPREDER